MSQIFFLPFDKEYTSNTTPLLFCNRSEAQIENLWIPVDSSAVVNKVWKKEHFKEAIRVQAAMLSHDDDVLTPEALLKVHSKFRRKPRH